MLNGHTLENTLVVADFDRTVTTGEPGCETAFNVFWSIPGTPLEMFEERRKLFEKYYPIELDHTMEREKYLQHMKDWNDAAMEVMGKYINEERLLEVIQHANQNMRIRSGIKDFFRFLSQNWVPIVVFSAGITNIIDWVLKYNDIPYDTSHANTLGFVDGKCQLVNEGVFIGRKNWESMPANIHELARHKTHKILLWDSISDLDMWDSTRTISSIGFLISGNSEKWHRTSYEDSFTHLVESDTSDNGILEKIMRDLEKRA